MKKILFLGPKPPPVTGYSNIVNELSKCLNMAGATVKYISTVPSFLTCWFPSKLWKISRLLYMFFLFPLIMFLVPLNSIIYINVNGGIAQIWDIVYAFLGRVFLKNIVLHHNSYSYLNKQMKLSKLLFFVSGKNATHIVNCEDMKDKLCTIYGNVNKVQTVSNVAILTVANPEYFTTKIQDKRKVEVDKKIFTVGFMGYFNKEKGLELFSKTIQQINESIGLDKVKAIAVGPVHDIELVSKLKKDFRGLIDFREPAYGVKRDEFFEEIDLLLFPSLYLNEAEPLTIHHSLYFGTPVVATDIGCLNEVLKQFPNSYSFSIESFQSSTAEIIAKLSLTSYEERLKLKLNLIDSYKKYSINSMTKLQQVLNVVVDKNNEF